jgi:hypothetical protein
MLQPATSVEIQKSLACPAEHLPQITVQIACLLHIPHIIDGLIRSNRPGVARLLDSVIYCKDRKSFAIYHIFRDLP